MGWCSGTDIFDTVVGTLLVTNVNEENFLKVVIPLIKELENQDWDCQGDSDYFEHPFVEKAFEMNNLEEYETWYDDEDDTLDIEDILASDIWDGVYDEDLDDDE